MPTIHCPGCKKQYRAPASAAGQTATCKACGKRFRLGAKKPTPKPVAATAPAPAPAPTPSSIDVEFWDDALSDDVAVEAPADLPRQDLTELKQAAAAELDAEHQPKKRWGFQWEKVAGGGATFLVASTICVGLVLLTGRLYFWPAAIALVGFFTMLSGLMGEEGIW